MSQTLKEGREADVLAYGRKTKVFQHFMPNAHSKGVRVVNLHTHIHPTRSNKWFLPIEMTKASNIPLI